MMKAVVLALYLVACLGCSDAAETLPPPATAEAICTEDGAPCQGAYPEQLGTCRGKAWEVVCCFGCWNGYTCEPGIIDGQCGVGGEQCSADKCGML